MTYSHINDAGEIGPCGAQSRATCPFGDNHHGAEKDLLKRREQQFERDYEVTMTITRKSLNLDQRHYLINSRIDRILNMVSQGASSEDIDAERDMAARMNADFLGAKHQAKKNFPKDNLMDDGVSHWHPTGNAPKAGFAYTPYPERNIVIPNVETLNTKTVDNFLQKNRDILAQDHHYVGLWKDRSTGEIHLEISRVSLDVQDTRKECAARNQSTFLDLQTGETVTA